MNATTIAPATETRFVLVPRPQFHFTTYEELSARERALGYYSDFHKEVHGVRPRHIHPEATAGQIQRAIRSLARYSAQQDQWEREEATRRVKELNRKALAKRKAAAKVAAGFTLGARWP